MRHMYSLLLLILFVGLISFTETNAQQILDSANVLTVDNLDDNNTGTGPGTLLSGPNYIEFPADNPEPAINDGWWTNTGSVDVGGNHRRASRLGTGNPVGQRARFSFDLTETDYYVAYHHMRNSGNSSPKVQVKFERFGEGLPVDTFYYSEKDNILYDGRGSWFPLGIVEAFGSDSSLTVQLGMDATGVNILRVDAVRLLRSTQTGADIEFGNRRSDLLTLDTTGDTLYYSSFYSERAPFDFAPTDFKTVGQTDRSLPIYNLGSQDLVISGFQFQSTRFSVITPTPIVIPPGGKSNITIRFAPLGEEVTIDTMLILSNDELEPEAQLPLVGEGINYNFILNASAGGSEPHWNVPSPGGVYEEFGDFLSSAVSPWTYPIPGGNISSRVSVVSDPGIAVFYKFQIPLTLFGNYYIEYSGPAGSSNAAQNVTVDVVTPFYTNPDPALADTQRVLNFNSRAIQSPAPLWARIGGNKVFELNSGGETVVRMMNPNQGTDYLRADLLRIRLVPIAPDISTNLDPARVLNFGLVSIFDSVRQADFNYQRNFTISSNGETPLVIDTIYLANASGNTPYAINNMPTFPLVLPSIDGQFNLLVSYLPDDIQSHVDFIRIVSNDPDSDTIGVQVAGEGAGTGLTVDDTDQSTYIFPTDVIEWIGATDPSNLDKWYRISGQGGIGATRLLTHIYFNPPTGVQKVEWFPNFPFNPNNPGVNEIDTFNVFVQIPTNSPNSSPAALYRIKHVDGITDTVISQLQRTLNAGKIPLGAYRFLRGGQDFHGSGTVFGSIELINDTALVSAVYADSVFNTARQDSFFLRADAVILEQFQDVSSIFDPSVLPEEFALAQNFPNPFNPTTQIRFALPLTAMVDLKIYDILGREVKTLVRGELNPGTYTYEWDGRNNYGNSVSSGMYIYRITAGKFIETKKMMMLK
jgi:hypothetical protein